LSFSASVVGDPLSDETSGTWGRSLSILPSPYATMDVSGGRCVPEHRL